MTWSRPQQIMLAKAAAAAGWNDRQRYLAMRHCGCPLRGGRPSMAHPGNTQASFELVMALAEAAAGERGERVPQARDGKPWRSHVGRHTQRLERLAREIALEAVTRLPLVFNVGLTRYTIEHTTRDDEAEFRLHCSPERLDQLDGGQLYRVVESLKAHVGRRFVEAGLVPRSFDLPASVRRRTREAGKGAA